VQVEIHSSGLATPRLGYEAFRLNVYKHNFLGRWRTVVDIAFVVLCSFIFLSDVAPIARSAFSAERRWFACVPRLPQPC
jgi:hypothetical protein